MSALIPILRPSSKTNKRYRRHIRKTKVECADRPLCGGGNAARGVTHWQLEFGVMADINCERCLTIAVNRIRKGQQIT
jgi:hypothetical protein